MKKLAVIVLALIMSVRVDAADFGGEVSGLDAALTLKATITPSGTGNKAFVGALVPNAGWFFLTPAGWQGWASGEIPSYSPVSGPMSLQILDRMNVSAFGGTQVYAGYGSSTAAMLTAGTYALIYTAGGTIPMGVRAVGANQLPPGCVSSAAQCWRDALANGTVRVLKTSITSGNREIVFVFFRGAGGLYNFLALFADNLFPSNIVGGNTLEIDWMMWDSNRILYHMKAGNYCKEFIYIPSPLRITDQITLCP